MVSKNQLLLGVLIFAGLLIITGSVLLRSNTATTVATDTPSPTPTPPIRIILLGDTGANSPGQHAVAKAIKSHCDEKKNCQAVFVLGDIIYEKGVETVNDTQFVTKFEEPYREVDLPFYVMYGNHDYLGCEECYLEYAKKSDKWKMPSSYYQIDLGEASFFALDTEQLSPSQRKWLESQMASSSKKWKIVMGHRPLETYESTKIGENWTGKAELQEQLCHSATLYAAGHAHVMEDNGTIDDCSTIQLVSGGAGAYMRTVKQPHAGEFFSEENGFVVLEISSSALKFEFIDANGQVLHSKTLDAE